jgi:hypothetical protein
MLILVYLKTVLILTQDSYMVSQNVPWAQKLFWTHPMALLGDDAQVDDHFGLFGDSAKLMQKSVHGLRRTYHRLVNHFGHT